jgi:hypothetical protein
VGVNATKTTFAASAPRQAAFLVYINGLEVPAKSVSLKYGVWDLPEMQIEMVADPVLIRLGNQDRVQVAVFYLDDCDVDPSVTPQFRLFGEGEITGWGYRNTSAGRSIVFTVVSQIAIWQQMIVQFLTNVDDMAGHATLAPDPSEAANNTPELVYPYVLFKQGLVPGVNGASTDIVRPFDYLYNCVKAMISSVIPADRQSVPAANFYSRWARLTNFHNRFIASPFFDETVNNPNIFPVLRALQDVAAIDVITKNLLPQLQGAGTFWDMLQIVFTTMLMEVAMLPSMPLVNVDIASSLVQPTNFNAHALVDSFGSYVSSVSTASRATQPLRIPNFFVKPQSLFGIPPTCNVIFPSQLKTISYQENYATQPTRLYYNDEVVNQILKMQKTGIADTVLNSLAVGYPPEVDQAMHAQSLFAGFNSKNFLVYPEEFFKGPVVLRSKAPSWLYFLKQGDNKAGGNTSPQTADGSTVATPPTATQTSNVPRPTAPPPVSGNVMKTPQNVGAASPSGTRTYDPAVEQLRNKYAVPYQATTGIPVDLQLAWVSVESDGNFQTAPTPYNERGYFQIMGPHTTPNGQAVPLNQVEAGAVLGLTIAATGANQSAGLAAAQLSSDPDFSYQQGIRLIQKYRKVADFAASRDGVNWTDGDMWRLTKLYHDLPTLVNGIDGKGTNSFMNMAKAALGAAPASWETAYNAVKNGVSSGVLNALNNATAVGGVVASASGQMVTQNDKQPIASPAAQAAPAMPNAASSRVAEAAPPAQPSVTPAQVTASANAVPDVYHLYAKYEYFRSRYAKRSGSATVAWNPYVIPGFPMALFDQRATRVDLFAYITAVQQYMDHSGQRNTTLSFMYGRQFQEMFADLQSEFALNNATVRGSAPQEPINEISQVVQSFIQSETYYEGLFFGGQKLFGKPATFDFRTVIGYAPPEPNGSPVPIFINGPDTVATTAADAANQTINSLTPLQAGLQTAVTDLQNQIDANQVIIGGANPQNIFNAPIIAQAQQDLAAQQQALSQYQTQLASINTQITSALTAINTAQTNNTGTVVQHNLDPSQELVPLPAAENLFDNRDAAMRYNWRPICTLDEYVTFYGSSAENVIPAYGHPKSVGAPYYERIRTLTYPVPNPDGSAFTPPAGTTGTTTTGGAVTSVPGLTSTNFPQTESNWDAALLAYRDNVLNNPAPRT